MGSEHGKPIKEEEENMTSNHENTSSEIKKMDKTIRKRVRGGITYNMKVVIRGDHGSGKTSLLHRLKGQAIPESHVRTPEINCAKVNWGYKQLEDVVKLEIWDVVDEGVSPVNDDDNVSENESGAHPIGLVDAQNVDVYNGAHCAIFVIDITKLSTLEYVRNHIRNVPVRIPTLILGNFRDKGHQRKIFKEDIHELFYGTDRVKISSRPSELHYFECSLLNCYGLRVLHQYFSIPFLHLRHSTLKQQIKMVEGDLSTSKYEIQASIAEQRYGDYIAYLEQTDSDIKTGRSSKRAYQKKDIPKTNSSESTDANQGINVAPTENAATQESNAPAGSEILLHQEQEQKKEVEVSMPKISEHIAHREDLPTRNNSDLNRTLKFSYESDNHVEKTDSVDPPSKKSEEIGTINEEKAPNIPQMEKASTNHLYNTSESLEDFTVTNDLDNFYSDEDDSDSDNQDVFVESQASTTIYSRRDGFLYSDDEDTMAITPDKLPSDNESRNTSPSAKEIKSTEKTCTPEPDKITETSSNDVEVNDAEEEETTIPEVQETTEVKAENCSDISIPVTREDNPSNKEILHESDSTDEAEDPRFINAEQNQDASVVSKADQDTDGRQDTLEGKNLQSSLLEYDTGSGIDVSKEDDTIVSEDKYNLEKGDTPENSLSIILSRNTKCDNDINLEVSKVCDMNIGQHEYNSEMEESITCKDSGSDTVKDVVVHKYTNEDLKAYNTESGDVSKISLNAVKMQESSDLIDDDPVMNEEFIAARNSTQEMEDFLKSSSEEEYSPIKHTYNTPSMRESDLKKDQPVSSTQSLSMAALAAIEHARIEASNMEKSLNRSPDEFSAVKKKSKRKHSEKKKKKTSNSRNRKSRSRNYGDAKAVKSSEEE